MCLIIFLKPKRMLFMDFIQNDAHAFPNFCMHILNHWKNLRIILLCGRTGNFEKYEKMYPSFVLVLETTNRKLILFSRKQFDINVVVNFSITQKWSRQHCAFDCVFVKLKLASHLATFSVPLYCFVTEPTL